METKAAAGAAHAKLTAMGVPPEVVKAAQDKAIPLSTIWAIAQALLAILPDAQSLWAKILEIIHNHQ